MAANTFGTALRLTSFGESHGRALGAYSMDFRPESKLILNSCNRKCNGASLDSPNWLPRETNRMRWNFFQVFEGTSTGSPIAFIVNNKDVKSSDYEHLKDTFRPSHADFTYQEKYELSAIIGEGDAHLPGNTGACCRWCPGQNDAAPLQY